MRVKSVLWLTLFPAWMAGFPLLMSKWGALTWEDIFNRNVLINVLIGFVTAAVTLGIHVYGLSSRARKYKTKFPDTGSGAIGSVKLIQELVVPRSRSETFELCRRAIRDLDGAWIKDQDPETGYITARRGASWNSWGERIEFRLTPIGERFTDLEVHSRPVLWFHALVLDSGRNLENITEICTFIRDQTKSVHMQELVAA